MVRGVFQVNREIVARRTDKGAPGTWQEEILWDKRAKIVDQLEPKAEDTMENE